MLFKLSTMSFNIALSSILGNSGAINCNAWLLLFIISLICSLFSNVTSDVSKLLIILEIFLLFTEFNCSNIFSFSSNKLLVLLLIEDVIVCKSCTFFSDSSSNISMSPPNLIPEFWSFNVFILVAKSSKYSTCELGNVLLFIKFCKLLTMLSTLSLITSSTLALSLLVSINFWIILTASKTSLNTSSDLL